MLQEMYSTVFDTTYLQFTTISLASFILYYVADDLFIAFNCGYGSRGGKGIIPGPLKDTRIDRFANGLEMSKKYLKKYGGIYRVFCGTIPEIVLTNPDDVRVFFHDAGVHAKSHNLGFGEYLGRLLGQCVGIKHNEDWRRLRSHIDGHFAPSVALESLPVMIQDVAEWLDALPSLPEALSSATSASHGRSIKIKADELVSPSLILKIVARTLFGELLDEKLFTELRLLDAMHTSIMARSFLSNVEQWKLASRLPTQANRDMEEYLGTWENLIHRLARESKEKGIDTAVSELYLRFQEGKMSFPELSQSIDEILFNNITVATNAITWTIILLAQHPDAKTRLQNEIDTVLDKSSNSFTLEKMEAYIRKTDTFLHQCCLEAGRLHPTSFYTLPEITAEPKVLSGYMVPAHTSVLIDVYTLNRKSSVWGDDGDAFRPERFSSLQPMRYRYSYLRFGFGPRKCVGQHFGDKIVKSAVLQLIKRYAISTIGEVGICNGHFLNTPAGTLVLDPRAQDL